MNTALLGRIRDLLAQVQAGQSDASQLADALRGNAQAMEGLSYAQLRQLESLADELQQAAELEADGFESPLAALMTRLQQWLGSHH